MHMTQSPEDFGRASKQTYNPEAETAETRRAFRMDLTEGPVDVRVGDTLLQVLNPVRDLSAEELESWRGINLSIGYFVTDPATFDTRNDKGYKALRDGESIVLGRDNDHNGRFDFDDTISRSHVRITREGDTAYIEDLNSTNGTRVGYTALRSVGITQPNRQESTPRNPERLTMSSGASSLAHEKHPDRNEDSYFVNEHSQAAGVFDGVGGHSGSELASRVATESVDRSLRNNSGPKDIEDGMVLMETALRDANADIVREVDRRGSSRRVATTATIAQAFEDKRGRKYAAIASTGDSRAYLYRNGVIQMLTVDQSMSLMAAETTEQKFELQAKFSNVTDKSQLTDNEQYMYGLQNQIFGALGPGGDIDRSKIQTTYVYLNEGDRILLTSDGVHDNMTTYEIADILGKINNDKDTASQLTYASQRRSREKHTHLRAKSDDMTAVVLSWG